ncbi:hypothetical protein [Pseudomonas fluorescens]|uniref:hypothetical protein n=1 Tax=Pseudomonas fluorescens TaxID=294 RepID=UPI0012B8D76A|nr:hypothetical protein [Pseudomonas fluorescens]
MAKLRILYGSHNSRRGYLITKGPQELPFLEIYTSPIEVMESSMSTWVTDPNQTSIPYRTFTSEKYHRALSVGEDDFAILSDKVNLSIGNLQFIIYGDVRNFDVLLRDVKTDLYLTANRNLLPVFAKLDSNNVQKFIWNTIWVS